MPVQWKLYISAIKKIFFAIAENESRDVQEREKNSHLVNNY